MSDLDTTHLDRTRDALLRQMLSAAPFDGWTAAGLERAEREAGLNSGTAALVCPAGVVDLIDFWALTSDQAMEAQLEATDLAALKVRERVTLGVRARIEAVGMEHREAARRAAARLAAPDAAGRAAHMMWRAADRIWRAIGDRSTDGNFYSKRVILSGVFASTFATWLNEQDGERVWAFLDRRIANVMSFEKAKAAARGFGERAPPLTRMLARARYGRR